MFRLWIVFTATLFVWLLQRHHPSEALILAGQLAAPILAIGFLADALAYSAGIKRSRPQFADKALSVVRGEETLAVTYWLWFWLPLAALGLLRQLLLSGHRSEAQLGAIILAGLLRLASQ